MDHRVEELFIDALELGPKDREEFLSGACAGDPGLRAQLDRLLEEAERADAYFTQSFGGGSRIPDPDITLMEAEGGRIGPFRLLHELGEGGFGVVWLAEQREPIFRQVAIKVIKAGMDTRQVLSRFDAERQALARMDHPNIARVVDAGVTATGRPYFAMELVKGIPITRYCEERHLDANSRLKLFSGVCDAIHHAHQKGVIHRDIKPSNILVADGGEQPQIKVIDFGIAKATEGRLTDATLFTRTEQLLGTPLYMSPEQAGLGGQDVDTRSDIYGLGALLYEMLTGAPPFDHSALLRAGYDEMRRIIREVDPVKPSLRAVGYQREATGSRLSGRSAATPGARPIPSDLDWIVMKAMEKSRDRRYETVNALANDILKFLADEPVSAKPPSAWYLFRKFTRRHRTGVWVGLGFVVLLISASVISTWQALRATRAEALAAQRLEEAVSQRGAKDLALQDAEAVSRLFTEVIKRPSPEIDGRTVTVEQALEGCMRKLNDTYAGEPRRHAMLLGVLAETYESLGLIEKSIEARQKMLGILKSLGETSMRETMDAAETLVSRLGHVGRYREAAELAGEAFQLREATLGPHDRSTLQILAIQAQNTFRSGEYRQAIDLQESLLRRVLEAHPEERSSADEAHQKLIEYCENSGDIERKAKLIQEFGPRRIESPRKPVRELAAVADLDAELAQRRATLTQLTNDLGKTNTKTIAARQQVASVLAKLGHSEEAIATQVEAVKHCQAAYGESHPKTLEAIERCHEICSQFEEWGACWGMREKAAKIRQANFGLDRYESLAFHGERLFHLSLVRPFEEEGIKLAEEVLPQIRRVMGPNSREYYHYACNYARCLTVAGRFKEATEVLAISCPNMSDDTFVNLLYASLLLSDGDEEAYERLRARMLDFWKPHRARQTRFTYQLQRNAFLCTLLPLRNDEQRKEIVATLEKVETILNSPNYQKHGFHGPSWSRSIQGVLYCRLGNPDLAIRWLDESLRISGKSGSDSLDLERALDAIYRPLALQGLGRDEDARKAFLAETAKFRFLKDPNEPLSGNHGSDGMDIALRFVYKEASKSLGISATERNGGREAK